MAELTKLGRYQLRRVLGRGAMGVVYDGFDPTINRRVAVKTILKSHAIDEEVAADYSARFVREAQAAGRLNHPNIVQVYDFGEQDDIAYLVMEFIQGNELRSFFSAKERFEVGETVRIMGELLDALDFAHDLGVVHRDVKPANVMLDSQRRVKLADFGVARVQDGAEQSQAGTMVGTPAFMSPEQISGGKIDRRTDVFSAGTILYQLLTGEQPFTGDGAWTVAKKIMQDNPARPSSIVTNLPLAFDEVVNRALAKAQAQRFASAKEFAAALRGVLAGVQPAATHPGVVMPKPKAAPASSASEAEVEFWRAIQNSTDAAEFEFYLDQFPAGTYAGLARHKIAKLKGGGAAQDTQTLRLEAETEAKRKLAEQRAQQEAEEQAKRRAAEQRAQQEAEAKARREAEETARKAAEETARREAQERARREAEEQAKRAAAEEKARLEAEARARGEAEERAKQAALEKVRQESAAKAKRDAELQARVDAEVKARREAADKARRESEEKVRQAQALARLRQQEEAAARAKTKAVVDEDSTVAFDGRKSAAQAPAASKPSYALPAAAGVILLLAVGVGAYLYLGRTKAPDPVAQTPAPVVAPKVEVPAAEIEKIRKETEDRIRREYADKSAAEQAAAAKAAADKAVAEKQLAMKAVAEKAAREKAAAEKLAREKAAAEKIAADKAAAEKAGATRAAAERSAADRAATEKAAADKAAAERAAADRAAAEKAAADKAAAERAAAAKPAPAPAPSASASNADALLQQGIALEGEKKYVDAVRAYLQAARAGSGPAAKRLGDIYASGLPGVAPDTAESTKWHTLARARGAMR